MSNEILGPNQEKSSIGIEAAVLVLGGIQKVINFLGEHMQTGAWAETAEITQAEAYKGPETA